MQQLWRRNEYWRKLETISSRSHRPRTWRETCAQLQKRPGELRVWELGFIADLPRFQRLSTEQRYCLNEIAERVLRRGEA